MKKKILRILSLGIILSFTLTSCGKPDNVIAKVGKEYITADEVNEGYKQNMAQNGMEEFDESTEEGEKYASEVRANALEGIIYQKILIALAEERNIEVKQDEIDEAYNVSIENAGGEEELKKYLENTGKDREEFEKEARSDLKNRICITKVYEDIEKELKPSDKEVEKELKKEIEKNKEKYLPVYNADHILYSFQDETGGMIEDSAVKAKIKEEAQKGLDEINSGKLEFQAKFDQVNSEATKTVGDTALMGQELNYFVYGDMVEPFSKAVSEMKAGEIGKELVETEYGYHIIRLNSKAENIDEIDKDYKNDIKTKIESTILDDKVSDFMDKAIKDIGVEYIDSKGNKIEDSDVDTETSSSNEGSAMQTKEFKKALKAVESFDYSKMDKEKNKKDTKKETEAKKETEVNSSETNSKETNNAE
ncbi:SurA N-terminal domain-containing protein [Miniphocaeibacter massiliensis]|uniref:SurA N-terminal domain-containing protein n=1 Tax=Miniphocaeibacter massiliensis TaxID=2041841 RepID=UPI000C1C1C52|nr:SurA N-terminal domain-containing protein [Miniphocaeibacter massiliensis]